MRTSFQVLFDNPSGNPRAPSQWTQQCEERGWAPGRRGRNSVSIGDEFINRRMAGKLDQRGARMSGCQNPDRPQGRQHRYVCATGHLTIAASVASTRRRTAARPGAFWPARTHECGMLSMSARRTYASLWTFGARDGPSVRRRAAAFKSDAASIGRNEPPMAVFGESPTANARYGGPGAGGLRHHRGREGARFRRRWRRQPGNWMQPNQSGALLLREPDWIEGRKQGLRRADPCALSDGAIEPARSPVPHGDFRCVDRPRTPIPFFHRRWRPGAVRRRAPGGISGPVSQFYA